MTKDELMSAVYAELDDKSVNLSVYERTLIKVSARLAFEEAALMCEERLGHYVSISPGVCITMLRANAKEFA
jgi:hypothetical protein